MSLNITVPSVTSESSETPFISNDVVEMKSPSTSNGLQSHQMFGIFLTIIGLVFVIPKLSSYYNEKIADKKNSKFMKRTTFENILLFAGILFFSYGIKEIFFKKI
jgi:hypothetical protein